MPKKSKNNLPTLTIVILNYNNSFWLKNTLDSIYKNPKLLPAKLKIIVVDNNSQDNSVDMLKQDFPKVELIPLSENLGFAAGNNVALRKIKSDYVLLLNNDTEFTKLSNLKTLLKFMEDNPQVAVTTPKLKLANGQIDLACHRGEPTPWASFTYFTKLEKLFPQCQLFSQYHQLHKGLDNAHEIDACSGAAMLVRNKAIKKVGLLDEQFFMYAEDLDWCKRFREKNYQIVYLPQVEIIHHKYKSGIKSESSVTATKIKHHFYNTMLLYYDKHHKNHYPRIFRWFLRLFLFVKRGGF